MHDAVFCLLLFCAVGFLSAVLRQQANLHRRAVARDISLLFSSQDNLRGLVRSEFRVTHAQMRGFMARTDDEMRQYRDFLADVLSEFPAASAQRRETRSKFAGIADSLAAISESLADTRSQVAEVTAGVAESRSDNAKILALLTSNQAELDKVVEALKDGDDTMENPVPSRSPSPTPESSAGPSPVASRSSSPVPMRATSPVPVPSSDHLPPRPASAAAQDRPRQICRAYQKGTCRRPDDLCRHLHICSKPGCGGRHPASACPGLS